MPRKSRKTLILAKPETVFGTDSVPTAALNAIQVMDWELDIEEMFASLKVVQGYFGSDISLPYARRGKAKFSVPLASSGTAGTAPAWGVLLQGCAVAETVTAASRTDYTPVTEGLKSLTIYGHKDGLLKKFVGCMGTFSWKFVVGEAPALEFQFSGLVVDAPAAAANPSGVFTTWKRPLAAGQLNTAKVLLGCTYSAGALSGGTAYDMQAFNGAATNDVQDVMLTTEAVDIFNRTSTGNLVVDFPAAAEATFFASMHAGTTTSVGLVHGSVAGQKLIAFCANALIKRVATTKNGEMFLNTLDLDFQPSTGNDEWRLVAA